MKLTLCMALMPILTTGLSAQDSTRASDNTRLLIGVAMEFPWVIKPTPNVLPNTYSVGVGYRIYPELDLYAVYNVNLLVEVFHNTENGVRKTGYYTEGYYHEGGIEARYFFNPTFYALGGIHLTSIHTRDILWFDERSNQFSFRHAPASAVIGSLSAGIGVAEPLWFFEFRLHSGLSTFDVIDNKRGYLFTYSLRAGMNLNL